MLFEDQIIFQKWTMLWEGKSDSFHGRQYRGTMRSRNKIWISSKNTELQMITRTHKTFTDVWDNSISTVQLPVLQMKWERGWIDQCQWKEINCSDRKVSRRCCMNLNTNLPMRAIFLSLPEHQDAAASESSHKRSQALEGTQYKHTPILSSDSFYDLTQVQFNGSNEGKFGRIIQARDSITVLLST